MTRICKVCGAAFIAARNHALYCSDACKRSALLGKRRATGLQRRYRRCPRCGKVFIASRSDGRTCGNACRQAMHRRRHRNEARA